MFVGECEWTVAPSSPAAGGGWATGQATDGPDAAWPGERGPRGRPVARPAKVLRHSTLD